MRSRYLPQELGRLEDVQLETHAGALAAVDAVTGRALPPGVAAARRAMATLDGVRGLLSKEAFLAAVLLRAQEVRSILKKACSLVSHT